MIYRLGLDDPSGDLPQQVGGGQKVARKEGGSTLVLYHRGSVVKVASEVVQQVLLDPGTTPRLYESQVIGYNLIPRRRGGLATFLVLGKCF